jgi:alkanesulfonate monooxygenase SsuD/methylene tetrahydromethanopterin reductase-like flavin-dependent oxidoreductase (luciferase family)
MKVGICYPFELEPRAALDLIRTCEQRGLDSVWIPENPGWPGAFATAGAVAAVTNRMLVSIGLVSAFSRLPITLAVEAGQMQKLSGGRFRLGIGMGSARLLADSGVDTSHPVEGIAETIEVLRPMLAGGIEGHEGKRHMVRHFKFAFEFKPPPIHIGTIGPKMTTMAGRLADGLIITTHASIDQMKQTVNAARGAVREAGRAQSDFHITSFLIACIKRDAAEARAVLRPRLAIDILRIAQHVPSFAPMFKAIGLGEEKIRELAAAREPKEVARVLTDEMVDALCFAGDANAFQRRLLELQAIGVNEVVLFQAAENEDFTEHLDDLVAATKKVAVLNGGNNAR